MSSPINPQPLGKTIADVRRSKGLLQKQVVDRIKSYYSDERAYRRIESGERVPDREALVAILRTGLSIDKADEINTILALGGYEGLTAVETQGISISPPPATVSVAAVTPTAVGTRTSFSAILGPRSSVAVTIGSLVVAVAIAGMSPETGYLLTTAILYASLYAESVLLESVFGPNPVPRWQVAATISGFVLATSVLALSLDARLARADSPAALPVSLGIFLISAMAQWVFARSALSEAAVVPMRFEGHTAQSAHLKNTAYFLVIVVLFWLLPFHCITALRRESQGDQTFWVKEILNNRLLIGRDFVSFNAEPLWYLCLFLLLLTLPMAVRLLEGLKTGDPKRNTYTALLYLRGILYFFLIVVCLIWYSSATASLSL